MGFNGSMGYQGFQRTPRNLPNSHWLLPNLYFNLATHLNDESVLRAKVIEARDTVVAGTGKIVKLYTLIFSLPLRHCLH